ncbi:hypothetical protein EDD21DRAFT_365937 [Dissophora ornata]|nr:hypothetical protein EDD21DRAFT_365937 [Dissophora ornata]
MSNHHQPIPQMAAPAPREAQGSNAANNTTSNTNTSSSIHTDHTPNLMVPLSSNTKSRPESPVNRKRADDDSLSGQGHHHEGGSASSNSLPPTKKSKTSPPLTPSSNHVHINSTNNGGHSLSEYRTSREVAEDALSPQTSPILEPLMPISFSMSEKRYSSATDTPTQSKARKLDDDRPLSPSFRATSPALRARSPPFRATSPPFRAASPSFSRSATAILDSLSKPGENSLGNLNLGTPIIGRMSVGERVMGVITSQPSSRHTSPDLRPTPGSTEVARQASATSIREEDLAVDDSDLKDSTFSLDDMPDGIVDRKAKEPSSAGAMHTSDDGIYREHDNDNVVSDQPDSLEEEAMHTVGEYEYASDSDDDFGHDSMDEIDVEGIEMLDSDSDSEASPYQDPDPLCLDRLTEEETDIILEEARMHGIGFVIRKYVLSGLISTKKMLLMTIPEQIEIPQSVTENDLIRTISERLKKILRRRKRLQNVHSLDHVVNLLKSSKRIMVLTGAGVSVSCGIPDFRSEDGIYSRLSEFELDDPQQMFDLEFFRERPQIFYSFAREIFPSNFTPSPSHYFIRLLEDEDRLLRNYTQNIDTLEQKAGIRNVLQCHGSFATASCVRCGHQVPGDDIKDQIFKQEVAYCKVCKTPSPPPKAKKRSKSRYHSSDEDESDDDDDDMNKGLMKPDIVFFGEKLPAVFHQSLKEDREKVDLLIVIGSSLKVAPVSDIMHQLPNSVPQILINRTPNHQMEFDVQLLGNCDTIVAELCRMAGWELRHEKLPGGTSNVPNMDKNANKDGSGAGGRAAWSYLAPNTYLFEGADLEELNFDAIQEKNRSRIRGEKASGAGGDGDASAEHHGDDEDEDSGSEGPDVEGMDELASETSRTQIFTRGDRASSTGMMDEDEVEDEEESDNGSEESQETVKGTSAAQAQDRVIVAPGTLLSPRMQPVGYATGTTEPRSGSITEIHQDTAAGSKKGDSMSSSLFSSALRSPTFASTDSRYLSHRAALEDDDDEEVKIRVMFTEKMPKDLGQEEGDADGPYGHGHALGHSRRPSEDLVSITEDTQLEVDIEDIEEDESLEAAAGTGGGESTSATRPTDAT